MLEDSHADMGLIQCVFDEWNQIFELLDDYLSWRNEEQATADRSAVEDDYFFLYDETHKLAELDLEGVGALLRDLVRPQNSLHRDRMDYYEMKGPKHQFDQEQQTCDFCHRTFAGIEFQTVEGKMRCNECSESPVDTMEMARDVFDEALKLMGVYPGSTVLKDVHLRFEDISQDVRGALNEGFLNAPSVNGHHPISVAVKQKKSDYSAVVGRGYSYPMTMAAMVYALTHIWEDLYLDVKRMTEEEKEGLAIWAQLNCLERHHLGSITLDTLTNGNEVYTRGYQRIKQLLNEREDEVTPFQAMLEQYSTNR